MLSEKRIVFSIALEERIPFVLYKFYAMEVEENFFIFHAGG